MKIPRFIFAAAGLTAAALPLAATEIPPQDLHFSVEHMDTSISPGDDFAKYAWGAWAARTEIPADKARWGSGDMLGENNWKRIRGILEEAAANPGADGSNMRRVGNFYASAMDEAAIEAAGIKPLQPVLDRIAAIDNIDDLASYVAYAHRHIGGPLFGIFPYADQKKNDTMQLIVGQGGLSLPTRDYYFDEKYASFLPKFTEHVAKMLVLAGASEEAAKADADTVLKIETELARISKTPTELRDPIANYNKMSVEDAAALIPAFPFRDYLADAGVPASETHFNIAQPKFLEGLNRLLGEIPLEQWKSYLRYEALRAAAPYLSSALNDERFRFFGTTLNGTPQQEPRWQRAARVLDANVGFAVGEIYVEKFFPTEVKDKLESMIANMREVLRDRIIGLDWMTEPTKQKALEKLKNFGVVVGYPAKWRDYTGLEISREGYFDNVMAAAEFESRRQMAKFGKPFDKYEWLRTPQQVNAYYQPSAGQLVFLAGILQPPYFDPEMDDAVNYGAIVAVIGHEISHGFDDKGRLYDASGNLSDWWTKEDADAFNARAEKLVAQFSKYEALPGQFVNGKLTLGENIGDLGGVSIAFEALQRSLKGKERKLIDGFTPEQRFFLSWAQTWKTKTRPDRMKFYLQADVHSPGEFRAFGPLVNVPEFFEAFDIKEGDPLWRSPEDRAKIW